MKNNVVKILATLGLIVAIALVLKGVFGVGKIGITKIFSNKTIIACEGWTGKMGTHYLAYDDEYIWYHWLCQKAYEKDGIYQKHGNSYNIYENQVVYTNIEWEGHTKIPQSTCYDIMKRLEKRQPQPFESKVMKYQKVNKKTGELTYHDAFTKITHYIFNHNYFREEEKNEYTIKT